MFLILLGDLSLLFGIALLLLPLLVTELSRPRDSLWGAVVIVLGIALMASHERIYGPQMIALTVGSLLIGRLGVEVGQSRWNQLSDDEKNRLGSMDRWITSFSQLGVAMGRLLEISAALLTLFRPKPKPSAIGKKWVRPEDSTVKEIGFTENASEEGSQKIEFTNTDQPHDSTHANSTPKRS